MKRVSWISTVLLCGVLSGCATSQEWWSSLKQGISGGEESAAAEQQMAPMAAESGTPGFYSGSLGMVFNAAIRASRDLSWEMVYAKEEERYFYALPLATLFEPRETIHVNFNVTAGGVEVAARTDSGHVRSDFDEFYARINDYLNY